MSKLSLPLKHIYVTQPFGVDYTSRNWYASFGMDGHNGIDFRARIGAKIYATHDGRITASTDDESFGKYIALRADDFQTRYCHCSKLLAKEGQEIKNGDLIALSGNTGKYTTGPHVHFDYKEYIGNTVIDYNNGYYGAKDPSKFFPKNWDKSQAFHRYGIQRTPSSLLTEKWIRFKNRKIHQELIKIHKLEKIYDDEFVNAIVYGGWHQISYLVDDAFQEWRWLTYKEYKGGATAFA